MITVMFVCLGNICRSPMAEAVFRKLVNDAGLSNEIIADSCGTSGWHVGDPPHSGTRRILDRHGVSYDGIFASSIDKGIFSSNYIIAMDESNLNDIKLLIRAEETATPEIHLLSHYANKGGERWISVPDPWITGNFELTYNLISKGCEGLFEHIAEKLNIY